MSNSDRHLTDEQLTSLLDDQFLPGEPVAEYRAHLRSCAQCQHTLDELRQTVALLHNLPQPALPRSFVLPLDTTQPEPVASLASSQLLATPASIIPLASRRSQQATFLRNSLRLVAILIAAIGVLLTLSGLLAPITTDSMGTATSSSASSNGPTHTSGSQSANSDTRPHATSTPPPGNQSRPSTVQPRPTSKPTSQAPPANNSPSLLSSLSTLNTLGNRIGLGILLFFLGAIGFTLFRQR